MVKGEDSNPISDKELYKHLMENTSLAPREDFIVDTLEKFDKVTGGYYRLNEPPSAKDGAVYMGLHHSMCIRKLIRKTGFSVNQHSSVDRVRMARGSSRIESEHLATKHLSHALFRDILQRALYYWAHHTGTDLAGLRVAIQPPISAVTYDVSAGPDPMDGSLTVGTLIEWPEMMLTQQARELHNQMLRELIRNTKRTPMKVETKAASTHNPLWGAWA